MAWVKPDRDKKETIVFNGSGMSFEVKTYFGG